MFGLRAMNDREQLTQRELGQFLTPTPVADLMAGMFDMHWREVALLDAGAGAGALTAALVRHLCGATNKPKRISVTAYEVDTTILGRLRATLARSRRECDRVGVDFNATLLDEDFIAAAAPAARGDLFAPKLPRFNAAIVNPPYRKIRSDSTVRSLLRSAGIETGNLYTGFVALIVKLLCDGGQLVAITPRSFCNGPYFRPFRTDFLEAMCLRRIHVFESRSAAFSQDDVLQENIIIHASKGPAKPERVIISSSTGNPHSPVTEREAAYRDVVSPEDPERFIHLVLNDSHTHARCALSRFSGTLAQSGLSVSTGRVVDFRARSFLRQSPEEDTAPLIYPCHFNGGFVQWPKHDSRKPNAIVRCEQTRALLVPNEVYVLVKRFTSKEERRRIVACIYDPSKIEASVIGFENHLNYFHIGGRGLPMSLAKGLCAFLSSSVVDMYFRQFSGHTQVNATDLRILPYPDRTALERLGRQIHGHLVTQEETDTLVEAELLQWEGHEPHQ